MLAVRWYLRSGLSYRDVEELPAEFGVDLDHVSVYAGPAVHAAADRRRPVVVCAGQTTCSGSSNRFGVPSISRPPLAKASVEHSYMCTKRFPHGGWIPVRPVRFTLHGIQQWCRQGRTNSLLGSRPHPADSQSSR
jgi:hypothetical protein